MNQRGKTIPKFCLQCKHAQAHALTGELICMSPDTQNVNLVTGFEHAKCEDARYSGWCGKDGIYFEQADSNAVLEAYQRIKKFAENYPRREIDFSTNGKATGTTVPAAAAQVLPQATSGSSLPLDQSQAHPQTPS